MSEQEDVYQRQQNLLDQLAISPILDVLGVVDSSSVSGGRGGKEELWTMMLTFEVWRIGTDNVQQEPLKISRKVPREELDIVQNTVQPYTVLRIKARVGESAFGGYQALLESIVGVETSDFELNSFAEQLQQPVTFIDPFFGTFTLDRRLDWFEAVAVWEGKSVSLSLSDSTEVQSSLEVARTLWEKQSEWGQRVKDYAVQQLLTLKNESWLEDDENQLTPDDFKNRMSLESISVNPDGSFTFWHDDGDLFFGHSIQISGSLGEGLTDADIPG